MSSEFQEPHVQVWKSVAPLLNSDVGFLIALRAMVAFLPPSQLSMHKKKVFVPSHAFFFLKKKVFKVFI